MTTETTHLTVQTFAEVVRGFFDNETPIDVRNKYQSILYEWECSPDAWKVASQCIRLFGSGPSSEVTQYAAQLLLSQARAAKGHVPWDFYQEILNLLKIRYEECGSVRQFLCEALAFCIVGQNLPTGILHDLGKDVGYLCCFQIMGRVPHALEVLSNSLDPEATTIFHTKFDFDSWVKAVFGVLVSRLGEFDHARSLGDAVEQNILPSMFITGQAWITASGLYAIDTDIASIYFRFCGAYWDWVESTNCVIEALDCCPENLIPVLYQTILTVVKHMSESNGTDTVDGYEEVLYRWKYAFVLFCNLNPTYCKLDTTDGAVLRQGLLALLVQEWHKGDLIDEYTSLDAEILDAIARITDPDNVDVSQIAIIHQFSEQFIKQSFFQSISGRQALFTDWKSLKEIFESEWYRIWTVESAEAVSNAMSFVSPSVFLGSLVREIKKSMSVQPFSPSWGMLHGCMFFLRSVAISERSSILINETYLSLLDLCIDVCYKILNEESLQKDSIFFVCGVLTLFSDKDMVKKLYAFCDDFDRNTLEEFVIKQLQFFHLFLTNGQILNEENLVFLKQLASESLEVSIIGMVDIRHSFEDICERNGQIFRDLIQFACSSLFTTHEEFKFPLIRMLPLLKVYSFKYGMIKTYQDVTEILERNFIVPIMDFFDCADEVWIVNSESVINALHTYLTTLNSLWEKINSSHEKYQESCRLNRLSHGWLRFADLVATVPRSIHTDITFKMNDSILIYIQLNPKIDPQVIEGIFNKSMQIILAGHDFSEIFAAFLCDLVNLMMKNNRLNWNIANYSLQSYLQSVHQQMAMGIDLNPDQTLAALLIGKMYFSLCVELPSNIDFSAHTKYIMNALNLISRCSRNASSHIAKISLSAFVSAVNFLDLSLAKGYVNEPDRMIIEHDIGPFLLSNLYGTMRAHILLSSGSFLPSLPKFLSLVTKVTGIAFQVSSHQDAGRAHCSLILETWSSKSSSYLQKPLDQAFRAMDWNLLLSLWTQPNEAALKRSAMRQLRVAANRMMSL